MSAIVAMSGTDTITLSGINGGKALTGLADGDAITIEFPNDLMNVKTGKNGNTIYGFNQTGKQCDVKIRLIRGSDDDVSMQSALTQMMGNPETFTLINGTFTKVIGDGSGAVKYDKYLMSGGVFKKQVIAKSNAEGDTEQSVSIYELRFTNQSGMRAVQ